jgi:hypothetical protein
VGTIDMPLTLVQSWMQLGVAVEGADLPVLVIVHTDNAFVMYSFHTQGPWGLQAANSRTTNVLCMID